MGRLGVFSIIGAIILLGVGTLAALAALESCALRAAILSDVNGCPRAEDIARAERLAALAEERAALSRQILDLEVTLGRTTCEAAPPDATGPLNRQAWAGRDLGGLYGCWDLGSVYKTRDVDSGKVISYPVWRMCFDYVGKGKQIMEGDDGSTCTGPVEARFDGAKGLVIDEGGNLACSDGGFIHQRRIACGLAARGAICNTLQPETDGAADIPLTRWR